MNKGKSFLRWAGSKYKLIPKLHSYWDDSFRRYIEPFMGSASLFFAIKPPKAILSDVNMDLIETFKAVQEHPRAVYNHLLRLPLGETQYYKIRKQDLANYSLIERAARFIYLNRFCFNGLYRTNMSGKFNVPYASSKTGQLPQWDVIHNASKILSCAQIKKRDFEVILQDVKEGDFVYMDPPYAVKNRRIFRQYGADCFGLDDLKRLGSALLKINNCGATFLVSYALCREALEVFKGWHIRQVRTQRSVAGFSKHRCKAVELLISNRVIFDQN